MRRLRRTTQGFSSVDLVVVMIDVCFGEMRDEKGNASRGMLL